MFGSSYGIQGLNINPFAQGQSFLNVPSSPAAGFSQYGAHPLQQYGGHPLQQVTQLLQAVPHQLQNLQQLQYLQQQQLQQVQQLVQLIPAQLWQLQQLIQSAPQQIQQLPQPSAFQQPFSQSLGLGGFPAAPIFPQIFGQQPAQVM